MLKYFFCILTLLSSFILILYLYFGSITYYKGPKSDHFNGKRFFNSYDRDKKTFTDLIKWQFERNKSVWPNKVKIEQYDRPPKTFDTGIRISYVGHSTVLLQVDGINILTDPIWSQRAGPFKWLGPKRVVQPGIKFEDLPKIDLVLISHNHYDHMDKETILGLIDRDNPLFITPLGNDTILKSFNSSVRVISLDWFKSHEHESLNINIVPALHWSSRLWIDKNKALWGGFVIETSAGNIYFSGDTAFGSGKVYDLIHSKFSNIKLSLIAIGAYEPAWFMQGSHNNPDDAVRAFSRLNSEYGIPIHYGTFQLSDESIEQQINDFAMALNDNQIDPESFKLMRVGQNWTISD